MFSDPVVSLHLKRRVTESEDLGERFWLMLKAAEKGSEKL